ncbi:TM2 domain-containing protein [Fusarium denticulatum]|uniref:TM2 domain-containing protein n=1 Tax=Fusarium denticulatum TaxID=48507 RepID=A0A8H5UEZ2_9HYPO|nr:TM2 domain-containing protein [Fusarium denticulatum]
MDAKLTIADKMGRGLTNGIYFVTRRWKMIMPGYIFFISIGSALLCFHDATIPPNPKLGRFRRTSPHRKMLPPRTHRMILSLLFGGIGADQFYAHHWPLAVFKLVTLGGVGVWAFIDMILWIVGVYGTPGCPGGSSKGWQY